MRRARRRDSTRCRWDVAAGGIRVTETERDRRGDPRRETVLDVPAWQVAAVGAVTSKRRIRLVASDSVRKELASVTLDEIPEGGAEALAARVLARLRAGQPG
jgi:regulator of protease activity HflC (stomatin/prohibitin superfamily)